MNTKLSQFANSHGYSDLESLVAAMDLEREAALMVTRSWGGVIPNGRATTPKEPDTSNRNEPSLKSE